MWCTTAGQGGFIIVCLKSPQAPLHIKGQHSYPRMSLEVKSLRVKKYCGNYTRFDWYYYSAPLYKAYQVEIDNSIMLSITSVLSSVNNCGLCANRYTIVYKFTAFFAVIRFLCSISPYRGDESKILLYNCQLQKLTVKLNKGFVSFVNFVYELVQDFHLWIKLKPICGKKSH